MTNFEKRKQMSADFERAKQLPEEEFLEWLFQAEEDKNTEPIWCKNRCCDETEGECIVCFNEWINGVVKE